MTHLKLIAGLLLFTLLAYGQTQSGIQIKKTDINRDHPSYIIFGMFCSECSGHCAIMYRYNMKGNSNTLFVDSTDSYLKNNGKVVCKTSIKDIAKIQVVNKLVTQIPNTFLRTDKTEQTFGCPDCADGCGIYFEMREDTMIRKFYIDYHTGELDKEVKDFGENLKKTLAQLYK